jgi:hypothetical protein
MSIHESNVNFRNLIRDLKDMYTYEVSEVVLIELIANALDAKATKISIDYKKNILIVTDNGLGMSQEQFKKYHDLAAGIKLRGSGIGFAGVGAKISFNIANKVITETFSNSFKGGSNWYLSSEEQGIEKLIWDDYPVSNLKSHGTRIVIQFEDSAAVSYVTTSDIYMVLKRHFYPLLDSTFIKLYSKLKMYNNVEFIINGINIQNISYKVDLKLSKSKEVYFKSSGKNIGYGIFGLSDVDFPFGEEYYGVLLCVYGKVVKSELFNQFPGKDGSKIIGIVEIPGLIKFLNTSKLDFMHTRGTYKEFENYYSPIRDNFKEWLNEIGIQSQEIESQSDSNKIEKELLKLINDIPELSLFLGNVRRKNILSPTETGSASGESKDGVSSSYSDGDGTNKDGISITSQGNQEGQSILPTENGKVKAQPISRSAPHGPKICFINCVERNEISWVEGNTIFINSGHPVNKKVQGTYKDKRLFYLVAIGNAVQRYLIQNEETKDLFLLDRILSAWGKL